MSDLEKKFKVWARRFWWMRGALGAMAIVALVPNFIDLSRYELLRAIHAIIFGWNVFAAIVGRLIGRIPFVPELSAETINFLVLIFALSIPYTIAFSKYMKGLIDESKVDPRHRKITLFFYIVIGAVGGFVVPSMYLIFSISPIEYWLNIDIYLFYFSIFFCLFAVVFFVFMAIKYLPGFGKGTIYVVSFFLCIEVLYLLETPILTEQINNFACEALELSPDECSSAPG